MEHFAVFKHISFSMAVVASTAMDEPFARSATDLARAWESCDGLRRRGHMLQLVTCFALVIDNIYSFDAFDEEIARHRVQHIGFPAKVQFDQRAGINRETVAQNSQLVSLTLKHIGSRVTVNTLEVHIQSFYDLMHINANRV